MISCCFIALAVSLQTLLVTSQENIPKLGVEGRGVTLPCNLPLSDPPQVTWTDVVFNMDSNPATIFSSLNNPNLNINPSHTNQRNFVVEPNFSLRMNNLNMDQGPGKYICSSVVDGKTETLTYYLNVHERTVLNCTGKTELREGEQTNLDCSGRYAGVQPALDWYRGAGEGEKVDSTDKFDIKLAHRTLSLEGVSYKDDQEKFTCRMRLGDSVEECSVTLSVKHLVRDVRFSPEVTSLHAGDELRCLASGNPAPRIEIDPPSKSDKSAVGMRAIVMEKEWVGKQIVVKCTASNTLNGVQEIAERNVTIYVKEEKPATGSAGAGSNTLGIIVGLVIAILLLVAIVVAVILIRRRKSQKPPKGAKPLPTKEQISHGQNGQSSQRPQHV